MTSISTTAIHLLGILRLSDRTLLSSYAPSATAASFPPSLLRELASTHPTLEPYKRHTEEGPEASIHFYLDGQGLLYACVTNKTYPNRVIFALLEETRIGFASRHHDLAQVLEGGREGGRVGGQGVFARQDKQWLKELVAKYGEPATVDKLYAVSEKVSKGGREGGMEGGKYREPATVDKLYAVSEKVREGGREGRSGEYGPNPISPFVFSLVLTRNLKHSFTPPSLSLSLSLSLTHTHTLKHSFTPRSFSFPSRNSLKTGLGGSNPRDHARLHRNPSPKRRYVPSLPPSLPPTPLIVSTSSSPSK